MPLVDRLAPEHLELAVDDPQSLFDRLRHAGSVFLGRHTPEAIGDYVAGPNHVLPTGRRARFASGLSVLDFMKRTSFLGLTETALNELGPRRSRWPMPRAASPCQVGGAAVAAQPMIVTPAAPEHRERWQALRAALWG